MKHFCFALLLLLPLGGLAEAYKWTDEHGNVHYGDQPDAGVDSETMEVAEAPASEPVSEEVNHEARTEKLLQEFADERQEQAAADAKAAEEAEVRAHNCEVAKDRAAQYAHASGVYDKDENGERVYLDKTARGNLDAENQEQIAYWCN